MDNNKEFKVENEKIIIKSHDELIDVIRKIEKSEADKIVLTFTEHSDILVSPINFKVLQDKADGLNKALIAQVMQNPIGIRNAQQASMSTTDSPAVIPDEEWDIAYTKMVERQKSRNTKLKTTSHKVGEIEKKEGEKVENRLERQIEEETKEPPKQESEFSKTVESAINRSKQELKDGKQRIAEEGGVVLALGEDISEEKTKPVEKTRSLIGKDFKELTTIEAGIDMEEEPLPEQQKVERKQKKSPFAPILKALAALGAWFTMIPVRIAKAGAKKGTKVIFWRIVFPLLVLVGFSGWLAYRMLPLVNVNIFIESKSIEVTKTFTGDPSVTIIDLENNWVPVKEEAVTKNRADNTTPSGVAYRGEKAEGIAKFKFLGYSVGVDPITIPAGAVITNTDGLSYETTTAFILGDEVGGSVNIFKDVAVRATAVGEEYNIASGIGFTVSGFDESNVIAESTGAFTGGSKEDYTVLAQADVDDVVETLENDAYKDAEEELNGLATGDWVIIESTIKSEIKGDITTDVPVGAEADIVNISIETESTALFYKKGAIESEVKQMLSNTAIEQNLFDNESSIELKLDDDITIVIGIDGVKGNTVTVSLEASGRVQMEVDKEKIVDDLKGMKWDDGTKYLSNLSYVTKPTEVRFTPDSFPKFLKYFPDRDGRIILTVKEIEVTEVE